MNFDRVDKAVTINDVARAAGVTKSTVSRALAGHGSLSPETRQTVLNAVEKLNYKPNSFARHLSQGRAENTVALFSTVLDRGVATQKLQILKRLLTRKGYEVPYHAHDLYSEVEMLGAALLLATLRSQRPRAIVCNAGRLDAKAILELQHYQKEGGIVVAYSDSLPGLDCDQVVFDCEDNTYQATRHLTQLGHRRIGCYRPWPTPSDDGRTLGYLRALKEAGLPANDRWLYRVQADDAGQGQIGQYEDAGRQVAEQFLAQRERPTAMVITNDYAAVGFVGTLHRAGLRVPEDVSVVGQDDSPIALHGVLRLTTAAHPVETIVHSVFEFLMDRLEGGYRGPSRTTTVRGDLVVRESTLPLQPQKRKAVLQEFDIAPSGAGIAPVLAGRNGRSSS